MSLFTWIGNIFKSGKAWIGSVAVHITEQVKTALASQTALTVENFIDDALHSKIAVDTAAAINAAIPKVLAVELGIAGLPDNPTEAQVLAFENSVYTAVTGLAPLGKSKLYTVLGSQIYAIISAQEKTGADMTFADIVKDVEAALQDYRQDLANGN